MSLPAIDISPTNWAIVSSILQEHLPENEVWSFGSRVTGKAKKYSDLDLVVISDKPLSMALSARLTEAFDESSLPWKVDVVDWATTSDRFRKIIERDKVVLQTAFESG